MIWGDQRSTCLRPATTRMTQMSRPTDRNYKFTKELRCADDKLAAQICLLMLCGPSLPPVCEDVYMYCVVYKNCMQSFVLCLVLRADASWMGGAATHALDRGGSNQAATARARLVSPPSWPKLSTNIASLSWRPGSHQRRLSSQQRRRSLRVRPIHHHSTRRWHQQLPMRRR